MPSNYSQIIDTYGLPRVVCELAYLESLHNLALELGELPMSPTQLFLLFDPGAPRSTDVHSQLVWHQSEKHPQRNSDPFPFCPSESGDLSC
jgi:hypothetical protein